MAVAKSVVYASIDEDGERASRPTVASGARGQATAKPNTATRPRGEVTGKEHERESDGETQHDNKSKAKTLAWAGPTACETAPLGLAEARVGSKSGEHSNGRRRSYHGGTGRHIHSIVTTICFGPHRLVGTGGKETRDGAFPTGAQQAHASWCPAQARQIQISVTVFAFD